MVAATVDEVEDDVSAIVDAAAAVPVGGPAAGIDELADGHSAGVARILGDSGASVRCRSVGAIAASNSAERVEVYPD